MKHTQIRQNCWETNSSSTHAITLNVKCASTLTTKPYSQDGIPIVIEKGWEDYSQENWEAKMHFLGEYLAYTNRKSELKRVEKIISDFAGFPITYGENFYELVPVAHPTDDLGDNEEYDNPYNDQLMTKFGYFCDNNGYGYESSEDFVMDVEKILVTDFMILSFLCSDGWFCVEHYRDG